MTHCYLHLKHCVLTLVLFTWFMSAHATSFEQGDVGATLLVGSGQAFNDNYTIVGAGIGYYVLDGLKLGVDAQIWLGGNISINKLSPQIQYVFARKEKLKPYVGVFFRKTSIEGFDDLDAAGGRGGIYLNGQNGYYISVGVVHEKYLRCNEAVFISCSDTYPEIILTFSL